MLPYLLPYSLLLSLACAFVHTSASQEQQPLREKKSSFDLSGDDFAERVNKTLAYWRVPGISIAVVTPDGITSKGFGYAKFPDTPMTPGTLFYPGSTTKAFTAAALSLLVDDNEHYSEVQWKTPINQLIRDDFVLTDDWATNHITIEDSLSHRSGLPRHDGAYGGPNDTVRSVVRSLRHLPLTAEPRTKYQYCNLMFATAGHVIETVTSSWLGDFLRTRIWEPLNMRATFFDLDDALTYAKHNPGNALATGYLWISDGEDTDGGHYAQVEWMDLSVVSGAGAVISNVEDYALWVQAMMDKSLPISQSGHVELRNPRTIIQGPWDRHTNALPGVEWPPFKGSSQYALGWVQQVYRNEEFWSHDGGLNGFGASVTFFPYSKFGVALMANTAETSNICELILGWHIFDELFRTPMEERYDYNKTFVVERQMRRRLAGLKKQLLFPNVTDPPMNLSAPLDAYTGLYHNDGYRGMVVTVRDRLNSGSYLHITPSKRTWEYNMDLEHISGDWFMGKQIAPYPKSEQERRSKSGSEYYGDEGDFVDASRAVFEVGADGSVGRLGLELESEMMAAVYEKGISKGKYKEVFDKEDEADIFRGMIWFDRA